MALQALKTTHGSVRRAHFELVQWPDGHPVAMTRADFADATAEDNR